MTAVSLAILLFAAGIFLLLAEIILPSHGVLGVFASIAILVAIGVCFWINQYAGLTAAVAVVVLFPFVAALWVKVWPHTPAGRRLILGPPTDVATERPGPQPGQIGVVVSELRPGGTCDFAGSRIEARAENGVIPAGRRVEVVAVIDSRPLVRAV